MDEISNVSRLTAPNGMIICTGRVRTTDTLTWHPVRTPFRIDQHNQQQG